MPTEFDLRIALMYLQPIISRRNPVMWRDMEATLDATVFNTYGSPGLLTTAINYVRNAKLYITLNQGEDAARFDDLIHLLTALQGSKGVPNA